MPVIVIGADTPVGGSIIEVVSRSAAEVRAFVSDERRAPGLKALNVKVALGDVSDSSHVEAAALNCFCAILVVEATIDGRDRAFADDRRAVVEGWSEAIRNAGLQRAIWVSTEDLSITFPPSVPEVASVIIRSDIGAAAKEVAHLESVASDRWQVISNS